MRKKKPISIFKRKLRPIVSYAFLLGVGTFAVVSASPYAAPKDSIARPAVVTETRTAQALPASAVSQDLTALKNSAAQFSDQLKIIGSQVAELQKYGRTPPPALVDAIGQGEQLASVIAQAKTFSEIGETDPAAKMQAIGATIAANSKF